MTIKKTTRVSGAHAEQLKAGKAKATAQQASEPVSDGAKTHRPASEANREGIGILGEVTWLMSLAPTHRHLFLSDLEWLVVPPIALRQFRLWRKDGLPVGFASWAQVSDDVHSRLINMNRRLSPTEWRSGAHIWLIDLVAPMGAADDMIQELKTKVFPNKEFHQFSISTLKL